MIGGQGADRITGGDGNDDLIGGHNVAGGSDTGDMIDGGAGNDWIAGDNADLCAPAAASARASARSSAPSIFDDQRPGRSSAPAVAGRPEPGERGARPSRCSTTRTTAPPGTFGDDNIAGGAQDDVIFGQLGNDTIQGDGSTIDDTGATTIDVVGTRQSVEDFAGPGTDGDDYIEGNGGNDTIFGDLGQDDLIGGIQQPASA